MVKQNCIKTQHAEVEMKEKSLAIMHTSSNQYKAFTFVFITTTAEKNAILFVVRETKRSMETKKKWNREWTSGELVFAHFMPRRIIIRRTHCLSKCV